ncbi:hypothetical protein GCM10027091_61350 [Streptomyces daliensis]
MPRAFVSRGARNAGQAPVSRLRHRTAPALASANAPAVPLLPSTPPEAPPEAPPPEPPRPGPVRDRAPHQYAACIEYVASIAYAEYAAYVE